MSGERTSTVVTYAAGEVFHPRCVAEIGGAGILLYSGGMIFWPAFDIGLVGGWPSFHLILPWWVVAPFFLYVLSAAGFVLFAYCRFIRVDANGITWRQFVRTRRVRWEEIVVLRTQRWKGTVLWVKILRRGG